MPADYLAGLRILFDGEVMGEQLMLALHAAAKTPREAWCFANILQLETETKAQLRPLMIKYGLGMAETADLTGIPARVAGYREQTWRDYAAGSADRLAPIVERYRGIAEMGPPEDQEILKAVVAHEAALLRWARMEANGPDDRSLDDVVALLAFPVERPGSGVDDARGL
jgi:hypothetical protein